jgi:hypothetical protein
LKISKVRWMVWIFNNFLSLRIEKNENHKGRTYTQGEYIRNTACIHSLCGILKEPNDKQNIWRI